MTTHGAREMESDSKHNVGLSRSAKDAAEIKQRDGSTAWDDTKRLAHLKEQVQEDDESHEEQEEEEGDQHAAYHLRNRVVTETTAPADTKQPTDKEKEKEPQQQRKSRRGKSSDSDQPGDKGEADSNEERGIKDDWPTAVEKGATTLLHKAEDAASELRSRARTAAPEIVKAAKTQASKVAHAAKTFDWEGNAEAARDVATRVKDRGVEAVHAIKKKAAKLTESAPGLDDPDEPQVSPSPSDTEQQFDVRLEHMKAKAARVGRSFFTPMTVIGTIGALWLIASLYLMISGPVERAPISDFVRYGQDAAGKAQGRWDSAKGDLGDLSHRAQGYMDNAKEAAGRAADFAEHKARELGILHTPTMGERLWRWMAGGESTFEKSQRLAAESLHRAADATHALKDNIVDRAQKLRNQARGASEDLHQASDKVQDGLHQASDKVQDGLRDVHARACDATGKFID